MDSLLRAHLTLGLSSWPSAVLSERPESAGLVSRGASRDLVGVETWETAIEGSLYVSGGNGVCVLKVRGGPGLIHGPKGGLTGGPPAGPGWGVEGQRS